MAMKTRPIGHVGFWVCPRCAPKMKRGKKFTCNNTDCFFGPILLPEELEMRVDDPCYRGEEGDQWR